VHALIEGFVRSGHVADIALAALVLEAAWFLGPGRKGRPALRLALDLALALGPGACLMLALRAATTGAPTWQILVWLAASFPLHLADLRRRGL
jgi:hypothetical protein